MSATSLEIQELSTTSPIMLAIRKDVGWYGGSGLNSCVSYWMEISDST